MRSQSILVASFMAVALVVILLFIEFIYILPETLTTKEAGVANIEIYKLIDSRANWTAKDLVEAIVSRYNPDYVNVSIKVYDILNNDSLILSDKTTYKLYNVSLNELLIYKYAYTKLYRNGHYVEYLVEVGFK